MKFDESSIGDIVIVAGGRRAVPLRLLDKTWLRMALFSPSSSAIRQTECSIIETMFLVPSRKRDLLDMLSRLCLLLIILCILRCQLGLSSTIHVVSHNWHPAKN